MRNLCGTDEHYLKADMVLGHEGVGIVKAVGPKVTSVKAAPLICAGATLWTVLTKYNICSTDRVAVMGVGGLGHLAIKLASEMGCHVVVLPSSESKHQEAMGYGAMGYGASEYQVFPSGGPPPVSFKPVNHLLLCGSGSVDYLSLLPLVNTHGSIYPLTVAFEPSEVPMLEMVWKGVRIQGSLLASRSSIRTLLEFAARKKVYPTIVAFPLNAEGIEEAMKTLREGKMRYRGVLVKGQSA
ncbi:alcohol dehydrogenase [Penicillium canescens]|nr:alcohol dehydrogenase [Penicillium canescens]